MDQAGYFMVVRDILLLVIVRSGINLKIWAYITIAAVSFIWRQGNMLLLVLVLVVLEVQS